MSATCTRIVHGANEQFFDNLAGIPIAEIRHALRDAFNIAPEAQAYVDGEAVGDDTLLQGEQCVEFSKAQGRKGLGELLTKEQLMERWGIGSADYRQLVEMGLPSLKLPIGVRHPEFAVDGFFGSIGRSSSVQPLDSAPTILRQPESKTSPYLNACEAAEYLGITVRSLYGIVERRRIIPLRGPKRSYRFTVEILDNYLRS